MSGEDTGKRLKSAYELALERLEADGIERPDEDRLRPEIREEIEAARRKAEAELAELEILHRDRLRELGDPRKRENEKEEYRAERRRIERARDRRIAELRGDGEP